MTTGRNEFLSGEASRLTSARQDETVHDTDLQSASLLFPLSCGRNLSRFHAFKDAYPFSFLGQLEQPALENRSTLDEWMFLRI